MLGIQTLPARGPACSVQSTGEPFDARTSNRLPTLPWNPSVDLPDRRWRQWQGCRARGTTPAVVRLRVLRGAADLLTITSDIGMDRNMGRCKNGHDTVQKSQHEPHGCLPAVSAQVGTAAEREGATGDTGSATRCGSCIGSRHAGRGDAHGILAHSQQDTDHGA